MCVLCSSFGFLCPAPSMPAEDPSPAGIEVLVHKRTLSISTDGHYVV